MKRKNDGDWPKKTEEGETRKKENAWPKNNDGGKKRSAFAERSLKKRRPRLGSKKKRELNSSNDGSWPKKR